MNKKEKAALLSKPALKLAQSHPITKLDRVLDALKEPSGLNRFEAERIGDHCLNSTVAVLRQDGYEIPDAWEVVPTRYCPRGVRVKRYRCIGRTR